MNTLMMAIQAIALLCGPRVQGVSTTAKDESVKCQMQMSKCVQTKTEAQPRSQRDYEMALAQCMQEIK